jgi:hypothetical protein
MMIARFSALSAGKEYEKLPTSSLIASFLSSSSISHHLKTYQGLISTCLLEFTYDEPVLEN